MISRLFVLGSAALAVVAGGAAPARAQSLRPNILFIFDTSASMDLDDSTPGNAANMGGVWVGENTNICPGGATSRIYNLKAAMRGALAQVGTDEANFGLMAFPQTVVTPANAYPTGCNPAAGGAAGTCGNWCRDAANVFGPTGHYQATPANGAPGVGCRLTTHTTQTTYGGAGGWFDMGVGQTVLVGVTTILPPAVPAAANFDPVDGNIPEIYKWIDNNELPTSTAGVTDPELHGGNYTPLGRSLLYARLYFENFVKNVDPKGSCRQNVVILMTDGAEECDTAAPTGLNLADCTGSANVFYPTVQACQLFRSSNIKTYVVTDAGLSAAGLANDDAIATAGGTTAAIRVSLANASAAQAAIVGIIASTVPPVEVCNGKDDNCNGIIDEGVSNMCPYSTTDPNDPDNLATAPKHCAVEIPNCLDDNCNGLIDEGFPPNACGQGMGCPIPPEICDGIDNNCNGLIDEGFNVGAACDNGLTGACRRIGIEQCTADGKGVTCNLGSAPVATEICNGIDDDCNGMIDDGPLPGVGVTCGITGGGCTTGITACVNGKIVCNSSSNPQPEVCNGKDDDCNGIIDDGVFPGVGDSCLCPGLTQDEVGVGPCRAGRLVCKGAAGIQCDGCVLPQPEICDGIDNNCDGIGDNMAMCPTGFGCTSGACALLCGTGEFPCPPGYDCTNSFCVPNRCKSVTCPAGQRCDNDSGSCVDLCFKVSCLSGQLCQAGRCIDCSNSPTNPAVACQPGQVCLGRTCVTDTCYGINCDPGTQYCSNGSCVPLNCSPACSATQKCVAGQCQDSLCGGVTCTSSQYCEPTTGACNPNMCVGKSCPYCAPATGECTTNPCASVACPGNCLACEVDPSGTPSCQPQSNCQFVKTETGNTGGGCACSIDDGRSPSSLLTGAFALLGMAVFLKRRRR